MYENVDLCVLQRNQALPSIHALLEADVARLWPASSASAPHSAAPVWSAFFGHPRLFERHVVGLVARLAGDLLVDPACWLLHCVCVWVCVCVCVGVCVRVRVCVCVCVFAGMPKRKRKRPRLP